MFAYAKSEQKQAAKDTVQKKEIKKPVISPNLTGIPDTMKSRFENLSGYSFDDVRVHYNSDKPAQLQALAFTQGNQVYIGSGQEKHLGHELGHVVQQKSGDVPSTKIINGMKVNDSHKLEHEADTTAVKGETSNVTLSNRAVNIVRPAGQDVIQCEPGKKSEVNPRVFYGYTDARTKYLTADKRLRESMEEKHLTVDSLNRVLSITHAVSNNLIAPLGYMRAHINHVLRPQPRMLSPDVEKWRQWLSERKGILCMPELTPGQCRYDIGLTTDEGVETPVASDVAATPDPAGPSWKEDEYKSNFTKQQRSKRGGKFAFFDRSTWPIWGDSIRNNAQKDAHNQMVDAIDYKNYNVGKANLKATMDEKKAERIINKTESWLKGPVYHKFFRLTSLMGMDFFAHNKKRITFVRGDEHGPGDSYLSEGAKAITDSEWEHAKSMEYLGESVKRVPVKETSDEAKDVLEKVEHQDARRRLHQKLKDFRDKRRRKK